MIEVGKITAHKGLHLRKEPNDGSTILATLPFGTVVDIDHREGNWLYVKYQFKDGYLYKDFVEVLKIPPKDIDVPWPPKPATWTKTIVVLVVAIVAAIMALTWGSFGWRP